jgi:phosphotransferase system  glucose/maltose/N-acetylglucosamine-specific IIC component
VTDKDVKGETPADRALFRLLVAGLVLLLAGLVACAVWPWVMGGAR